MNFASLFGDDEHTSTEDAYARAMKCRKWLVIAASLYFLVHGRFFAPAGFSVLVGELDVPLWLWDQVTIASLIYAAFQYGLLLLQLCFRYPAIFRARFSARQAAAQLGLQDQLSDIEKERERLRDMEPSDPEEADDLDRRYSRLEKRQLKIEAEQAHLAKQSTPPRLYQVSELAIDFLRLASPLAAFAVACSVS